jgi:phosphoglycerate kinase
MFRAIDEVDPSTFRGMRVLVRAGLDLPLDEEGNVSDLFRVKKALPTLRYLSDAGAKVIILSHIGRDVTNTNEPVQRALTRHIKTTYVPDLFGHVAKSAIAMMAPGDILLLENLRQDYDAEKANDQEFAANLAALGEIYVNDAFSNSHRAHASMVGIPKLLPHFAGFLVQAEVKELSAALNPPHPAFAIIGGAKFETKVPVITMFLEKYDHTFVTGALANDVFKAGGLPVGRSRVSDSLPSLAVIGHPRFVSPNDVTAQSSDGHAFVKKPREVVADDKIVDIGPDTVALIAPYIERANFILWNGTTGLYEEGFTSYMHAIAALISHRVASGGHAVIGGGDTIAVLEGSGLTEERLGFFSTGGGAMLEYMIKGSLPALEALA